MIKKKRRQNNRSLTHKQSMQLLSRAADNNIDHFIFLSVALFTGINLSDLLRIRWRDVDFIKKVTTIYKNTGYMVLAMDTRTVGLLERYYNLQITNYIKPNEDSLIFGGFSRSQSIL